jgi:hypothetical protein
MLIAPMKAGRILVWRFPRRFAITPIGNGNVKSRRNCTRPLPASGIPIIHWSTLATVTFAQRSRFRTGDVELSSKVDDGAHRRGLRGAQFPMTAASAAADILRRKTLSWFAGETNSTSEND